MWDALCGSMTQWCFYKAAVKLIARAEQPAKELLEMPDDEEQRDNKSKKKLKKACGGARS